MSEPVLKAILRLFALVAKEDEITDTEVKKVEEFLSDHLNDKAVKQHLGLFNSYADQINHQGNFELEKEFIQMVSNEINKDVAQRQKSVILMELLNIIMADGSMSEREQNLAYEIKSALRISDQEFENTLRFVSGTDINELDHASILVVDEGLTPTAACHRLVRANLNGFISFLHIDEHDLFYFRYVGKTEVYLNGMPQKPGNINVFASGSLVRWESASPIYFGEVLATFKAVPSGKKLTLEARNISYQFATGKLGLRDVNIAEETGNLVALMGASGAGKSTLLHVLNGTEVPSAGQVLINGIDIHRQQNKVNGVIGFVPQDDLLMEDLTVFQNLYFAAKLCFNHYTEHQINKLVTKKLDDLGLSDIKNLTVGSPLKKTISGGQRKRLNIGLELLREPSVLFVDEPTSGLSSRDSENIIDLLKELSLKGKLVFAVIHQPSSDIFKLFDKLVILDTGGYQIYYGNPVDAVSYFKKAINMVNSDQGECHVCGNVNPEQIFNIIETKVVNEFGNFTNERKFSAEQWNRKYLDQASIQELETVSEPPESTLRIPRRPKQTYLFGLRDLLSKLSNKQYLVINLLEAPVLAFILGFITRYYDADNQYLSGYIFSKNPNLPAYLFMGVIVALFMGLTVSAEEIIRDRKILKREKFLNLSRSSYLISKISILFLLSAIQTALFVFIGNFILGIQDMFLAHWAILFTVSCFANLLGLNISSAFNSAVTIYILIPVLLIPQLLLSGVVVKFDKLNPVIGNTTSVPFVGDLMASRWAFEASMVTQFKDNPYEKQFYELDKAMAKAAYKRDYLIPELESKLDYVNLYLKSEDEVVQAKVVDAFILLRHEFERELNLVGQEHFTFLDNFTTTQFDSLTFLNAEHFLETLRLTYIKRYNSLEQLKEKQLVKKTSTAKDKKSHDISKGTYQNESIADLVKNATETQRIVEKDSRFVQKWQPIYKDPEPESKLDFDAQFYSAYKGFLNQKIDTFWFNTAVIWSMTLALMIALYFDWLRKLVDKLSGVSNKAPKRM